MKIAVVGASGRTGRAVVRMAAQREHHVVAVVRNPGRLGDLDPPDVRTADAVDPEQLAGAIQGVDTVVMCVGPVKGEAADVQSSATAALLEAMARAGVGRLVAVSASGWVVDGDDPLSRYVAKPILARFLREQNAALAAAEELVSASDLDWTIVRPPRLTDRPASGRYHSRRDGNVRWRYSIRRADLAQALLDAVEDRTAVRQRIGVAR